MSCFTFVQDIPNGVAALEHDLAAVLGNDTLADRGWVRPDDFTLLVPLFGTKSDTGTADLYLLRLTFDYYADHPPCAKFIDPVSLEDAGKGNARWIPRIENAPNIGFHVHYDDREKQLICSSTTLGFYRVSHSVEDRHRWNPASMTFLTTIVAIKAAMAPAYYRGRQPEAQS